MALGVRITRVARIALVLTMLATALTAMLMQTAAAAPKTSNCDDPDSYLSGAVDPSGTFGTVRNFSEDCTFDIGIASYKRYDNDTDTQELYDWKTIKIRPMSVERIDVELPPCVAQVDLFWGEVLRSLDGARYGDRLLNAIPVGSAFCVHEGRMTGGGSVFTDDMRVTHGFQIRCDYNDDRQNLEINWDGGQNFHLLDMTFAQCSDDTRIGPENPQSRFDTYYGVGTGRFNGVDGFTIDFTFRDAGEPGTSDTARILIKDPNGRTILAVEKAPLEKGNHQAHEK
jgi:hypothetical protein